MVRAFFQSILRLHLDVEMRGLHATKENSTSEVCISEMVGRSGAIRWRSLVFFWGGSRVPSSGLQHISKAHQLSGDIAELLHKKLQKAVAVGCCGSRVFTGRFKRFSSRCQVSDPCWSYLIMVMCHLDFRWKNLEATCLFPAQPVIENVQQQTDITEILPSLN